MNNNGKRFYYTKMQTRGMKVSLLKTINQRKNTGSKYDSNHNMESVPVN